MNQEAQYKIEKLIEEGIVDNIKNNKLATGLGLGALGTGAAALNYYMNSDHHYTDPSWDIQRLTDRSQKDIDYDSSWYNDNTKYHQEEVDENIEKLRSAENREFKSRPSAKLQNLMNRYGSAAENVTSAENPKSIEDYRKDFNNNFRERLIKRDETQGLIDNIESQSNTLSPAEQAKVNLLYRKIDTINNLYQDRSTQLDNIELHRSTPEYVSELEKAQLQANNQLQHAKSDFEKENNKFADKWLDNKDRVDRYQHKIDEHKAKVDSNNQTLSDIKDKSQTKLDNGINGYKAMSEHGKQFREDDILNSKLLGTGALGLGATATTLANRKKK